MKNFNNYLLKFRLFLLVSLPFALVFSYHPRISLSSTSSMNLELSIPLLWLLLFALSSLPRLPYSLRSLLLNSHPKFRPFLLILFCFSFFYPAASIFWSPNPLRAILTFGVFACLLISSLTISELISSQKIKTNLCKSTLISGVFAAFFCLVQCILDIFQVPPTTTLLCQGCSYQTFGFPHPNGFAIEPQFMGNLLIAPTFLALALSFDFKLRQKLFQTNSRSIFFTVSAFLLFAIFLTFSRGAIYSSLAALFILFVFLLIKHLKTHQKITHLLLIFPLLTFSVLASLLTQGLFAQISPTNDTFLSGVTKSVHQLSLGKIDFRPPLKPKLQPQPKSQSLPASKPFPSPATPAQKSGKHSSLQTGYIAESTNIRLKLSRYGLDLWKSSPQNLIFGVGLGGAGQSLYQKYPSLGSPKEIIQNEYITVLAELGLIGFIILSAFSILIFFFAFRYANPFFLATLFAFFLSVNFFSGFPNALHIYLLSPALYYVLASSQKPTRSNLCEKN